MGELFGAPRKEFFHLESVVSQVWRRGSRGDRLLASQADDYAIRILGRVSTYSGTGDVFSTRWVSNAFATFCRILEGFEMARKVETKETNGRSPDWKGFLERRLEPDELEDMDSWTPDAAELMEALHGMLVDGYTFTLSFSERTGQACFSLRDNNPTRKTAGYCMTTFDGNCALALKAGVYKQKVVLSDDWTGLLTDGKPARRG